MIKYENIRPGNVCCTWCRVSTKYQADIGGSLISQKEICEKYAAEHGYVIKANYGGKHESAKTPGPLVRSMMAAVKRDTTISAIIISEFDRLSREVWQATKMLQELRELGVIVIAAKFGLDTRTKEGMMMAQNTLAMAQWDNQNRTDKFVGGRADCMRAGAWIERAPLGYYKVGKSRDTHCYLNDDGKLIAQAFKWKLAGMSSIEITEKLKARGLEIYPQQVHKILVNPFYAGKIVHNYTHGEMIDGQIEPAVTYADFLKVQDILAGRTAKYTVNKENERRPLTHYVICSEDGTPFTSYCRKKKTKTHMLEFDYYKCNHKGCGTNVSAKEMHEKYVDLLSQYQLSEESLRHFESIIHESLKKHTEEANAELTTLRKRLTAIDNDIKKAKVRYASGQIDTDIFETAMQEYNDRRNLVLLEIEKWQGDLSNLDGVVSETIKIASSVASMWESAPLETKRKIQRLVFPDGIIWDKEIRNYRTQGENTVFAILRQCGGDFGHKKGDQDLLSIPLCGRWDSNPHAGAQDPKSCLSTNFNTPAEGKGRE